MGRFVGMAVMAVLAVSLAGCAPRYAPGVGGGIVRATSDEAVPPNHEPIITYAGRRGTVGMPQLPSYTVRTLQYGDMSVSVMIPEGWTLRRQDNLIVLINEPQETFMVIYRSPMPVMEVVESASQARETEGITISDLTVSTSANDAASFTFERADGNRGMFYGALTDYRNPMSGIVAFGIWPASRDSDMRTLLTRIVNTIVIRSTE